MVFVSTGAAHFARDFREEWKVTVPILLDPERESYRLLGWARALGSSLNPRAVLNLGRALGAGFRQGRVQGDAAQQGGVLVVARGGAVVYRYRSGTAGDHPPPEEALQALLAAGR